MSVETILGVIAFLKSDTVDSTLIPGHTTSCLLSQLQWTGTDERVYRMYRPMPLKTPEILVQEIDSRGDRMAPTYNLEPSADIDLLQFTVITADPL